MIFTLGAFRAVRPSFLIFLAALTVRLTHLALWQSGIAEEHLLHDGKYFDALAFSILEGARVSDLPMSGLTSTYTIFLFFCYRLLGHDLMLVRIVQIGFGSLACVGLYQLARDYFGHRAGWIAGGLAVFCGVFIYFDSIIAKPSMVNSLIILTLWTFNKGVTQSQIFAFVASAVVCGLAVLSRENLLLTLPCFVWAWSLSLKENRSRSLVWGGIVFMIIVAAVFWSVPRYYQSLLEKTKNLAPVESILAPKSGIHFFIGNQKDGNGTYKRVPGVRGTILGHVEDARDVAEKELGRELTYRQVNGFWLMRTKDTIFQYPSDWAKVVLKKFFLIWNAYEVPSGTNYDYWRRYSPVLSLPLVAYGGLVPFALLGWVGLIAFNFCDSGLSTAALSGLDSFCCSSA